MDSLHCSPCRGARVLIVDGDRAVVEVLLNMVEFLGAAGDGTTSVNDVPDLLTRIRPTIVLVDRNLPGGGGAAVLDAVCAWSATTPVVQLAGAAERTDAHFVDSLLKPIQLEALQHVIERFGQPPYSTDP